ncbi:hypothetical protein CFH99_23770 [Nocardioides aromaticivorans]|uniref:Uncharacterized protein n=1 Tax=Nocardioides aromaticivorans TaxID=200618 RepID=A0ABX7PRU0_9ACTN|nr:hypothetical protein [Nocardioides aromaticivorans]QSR28646.1 hypothetical protein CFH99_23770 [Nocardioides aromaticivorans]
MNHTRGWRTATILMTLLGLCQVWWAGGIGDRTSVSAAILAPLSLLSALALSRVNALETRLPVVVVTGAQLCLTVLALTIGLPGQVRHDIDVRAGIVLAVAMGILVAIEVDRRERARSAWAGPAPYAR